MWPFKDSGLLDLTLLCLFMLFVTIPYQTGTIIQGVVVNSINEDYSDLWDGHKWSGYTGLAVAALSTAIFSWFVPSMINVVTCKWSMTISGILYCLAFLTFIRPVKSGLIWASIVLGLANSVLWTASGNYLALISNAETIVRNTGLLWATISTSTILGNIVIIKLFTGEQFINSKLRQTTYAILIFCGLVGVLLSIFLRNPERSKPMKERLSSPLDGVYKAIKLLIDRKMILIAILSIFIGFELTFFTGLYSTSVASTIAFGVDRKKYSGECGLFIGIGELIAGIAFALTARRKRTDLLVVFSYLLYLVTFACIFVNLPFASSIHDTDEPAIFNSNIYLALFCALLLGLCDGLYETQCNEFIASVYKEDSSGPFAIVVSLQSIGGGFLFYLSNYIGLHVHIIILSITATIGTLSFCVVKKMAEKSDKKLSITSIKM